MDEADEDSNLPLM